MINGTIRCDDSPHISSFLGSIAQAGTLFCIDSTHLSPISGYIISSSDSSDSGRSFTQGYMTNRGDLTLTLTDTTWGGGTWNGGTYVNGRLYSRWFDPVWINYSLWYVQDSSAAPNLIGYRYCTPISDNVGQYYVPMVVPNIPGKYEIRWRYQKKYEDGWFGQGVFGNGPFGGEGPTPDSYAKEMRVSFNSTSNGVGSSYEPLGFGESGFGEGPFGGYINPYSH